MIFSCDMGSYMSFSQSLFRKSVLIGFDSNCEGHYTCLEMLPVDWFSNGENEFNFGQQAQYD